MIKKILLIRPYQYVNKSYWPFTPFPPLGIEYLAMAIKDTYNVFIFDALFEYQEQKFDVPKRSNVYHVGATDEQIVDYVKKIEPDVVGISASFMTIEPCVKSISKAIKKYNEKIQIVVGGPYVNSVPEIVHNPNIDYLVMGEGEETFKEMLDSNLSNISNIKGVIYKENGKIINTGTRKLGDIEKFAFPTFDVIPLDYFECWKTFLSLWINNKIGFNIPNFPGKKGIFNFFFNMLYKYEKRPNATILTSRGCPYNCSFCAVKNVWGIGFRMRSANNVLEEIDYWVHTHGIKHINIVDDNFTVNKDRVMKIAREISRKKYNLTFSSDSGFHINHLDHDILNALKGMGFKKIGLGIESGCKRILNEVIRKKTNFEQIQKIISLCKKTGFLTEGFFILGLPGETVKERIQTIDFIKKSELDVVRLYTAQPIPGTDIYNQAKAQGNLSENYDPVNSLVTDSVNYFITNKEEQKEFYSFINETRRELRKMGKFKDRIPISSF